MTEHANETNATDETAQGRLLGAADIRRIAAEAGISPTKKFGQNFVIDPGTVRRIVREAGVTADDHVLEVGPGLGSLTFGDFGNRRHDDRRGDRPARCGTTARHHRRIHAGCGGSFPRGQSRCVDRDAGKSA